MTLFGVELLSGLKGVFLISAVLRMVAWAIFYRVPIPERQLTRPLAMIRSAVRSFNPGQGLGPLLHVFSALRDE